jgi:hypothetical protein
MSAAPGSAFATDSFSLGFNGAKMFGARPKDIDAPAGHSQETLGLYPPRMTARYDPALLQNAMASVQDFCHCCANCI